MITQKAISLKVDIETLNKLNDYCKAQQVSRNRVINDSIKQYINNA